MDVSTAVTSRMYCYLWSIVGTNTLLHLSVCIGLQNKGTCNMRSIKAIQLYERKLLYAHRGPVLFQPLNPNPDSRWNNYFKDNEILLQIDKDVR